MVLIRSQFSTNIRRLICKVIISDLVCSSGACCRTKVKQDTNTNSFTKIIIPSIIVDHTVGGDYLTHIQSGGPRWIALLFYHLLSITL
jgi:hypothetical protein